MEVKNTNQPIGSLNISTGVVEKIAKLAALEVEGVAEVSTGSSGVRGVFAKTNLQKPVTVAITDGVAEIDVNLVLKYGCKVPSVCKNVQEAVKSNVQLMTEIAVSKVNINVTGVQAEN